jgi:hypothetical protein
MVLCIPPIYYADDWGMVVYGIVLATLILYPHHVLIKASNPLAKIPVIDD